MGTISDAQRQWLQSLGNIVAPRTAKVPSPRDAAEQHVARQGSPSNAPAATGAAGSPATTFDRSKSAVGDDDGRLSADVEYAKLPSALREKLSQQFWAGLETQQRRTLVETYSRLKRYGVWDYIKRVTGEKEHPEKHVKLFGFEFETDGNSGGLTYEASDAEALVKKLKASGHFGEDGAFMGLMHPGQKSNREWANDPDDPRGAHVSTGKGNQVDAHIDKQAPVGKPVDGKTTVDPRQAYKHGTQELIPEAMRKKLGGVPIKPTGSIEPNKDGWHGGEAKIGVEIELRGPVKKKKPNLRGAQNAADPAPEEIQARIAKRVAHTNARFPISVGTRPDEVPENAAFATVLAATVMEAARGGKTSVQLDMPYYQDKQADQPAALKVIGEIGVIVRSELGALAGDVKGLKMTFGSRSQSGMVSLLG
jgi:hypothetical protein